MAGSSARREFERRRSAREDRIRRDHPMLGGLILAATGTPRSTTAWDTGARGEEALGRRLDGLANDSASVRLLHDRRMPGSRANIDHIAVAPSGIFVVDAKKYRGRPRRRVEGGLRPPRVEKLLVGTRDRTPLVGGVAKQVEVVREVVGPDVPVRGVLCFVEADFPLVGGSFTVSGVDVVRPRLLRRRLSGPGSLGEESLEALHRALASARPPA